MDTAILKGVDALVGFCLILLPFDSFLFFSFLLFSSFSFPLCCTSYGLMQPVVSMEYCIASNSTGGVGQKIDKT